MITFDKAGFANLVRHCHEQGYALATDPRDPVSRKIAGIKLLRTFLRIGLKEAKELIESVDAPRVDPVLVRVAQLFPELEGAE